MALRARRCFGARARDAYRAAGVSVSVAGGPPVAS